MKKKSSVSHNALKDNNGNWVVSLEITEELWMKLMQETLSGVIRLLESCEKLLANGGSEIICAGLYVYAVEEYGKLLFLKKSNQIAGKRCIIYRNKFRNHDAKFDIAIKNLPPECITLHQAAFDPADFDSADFDTENIITDNEARLNVFYADLSDDAADVKSVPFIETDLLKKAIAKLRTETVGTSIP